MPTYKIKYAHVDRLLKINTKYYVDIVCIFNMFCRHHLLKSQNELLINISYDYNQLNSDHLLKTLFMQPAGRFL